MKPKVFLITGVARAGKDTFAAFLMDNFSINNYKVEIFKFANVLKDRGNDALKSLAFYEKGKIDFHNEEFKEKNRGMLVEMAKTMRSLDKDVFARHLNAELSMFFEFCPLDSNPVAIISDWRYLNEYNFVKKYQQDADIIAIEICRPGFAPANEEESQSLKELFGCNIIDHIRTADNPYTLKQFAKEISLNYTKKYV
jgi:hypothetical protein